MSEKALTALWLQLHGLRDSLRSLSLTIEEDHPPTRAVPQPVQRAAADVADLLGDAGEAIEACASALSASTRQDGPGVRNDLRTCHERLDVLGRRLADGLTAPERLDDLTTMTRERGPAWHSWRLTALDGIARARTAQWDAHAALVPCWAESEPDPSAPQPAARATLLTEENR
jgi:hypothetical protein